MSQELVFPEIPPLGIMKPIGDDDRRLLSSYGTFIPVQEKQTIIHQGEPQDQLYFLISGLLHATSEQNGRIMLLGRINPGETFGEVNIFDPQDASASVIALEFSQVWKISRESLEDFMNTCPLAAAHLLIGISMTMAKRLRGTVDRFIHQEERLSETS